MLPIGYLHTDFLRRFLLRGKVEEVGGTRVMKCLIKDGQRLYQPKDRQTKGVVTVQGIRELLNEIPKVRGDFADGGSVSTASKYSFALEAPPSAVALDASQGDDMFGDEAPAITWAEALEKYTLLTPDELNKSIRDRRQYVAGIVCITCHRHDTTYSAWRISGYSLVSSHRLTEHYTNRIHYVLVDRYSGCHSASTPLAIEVVQSVIDM